MLTIDSHPGSGRCVAEDHEHGWQDRRYPKKFRVGPGDAEAFRVLLGLSVQSPLEDGSPGSVAQDLPPGRVRWGWVRS